MVILSSLSPLSLVPLAIFVFFLLQWFYASSKAGKQLPPSPPKLPIIGHIHKLGLLPHRSLHSLSQKYGPLMQLHFGSKPVLVVSSADAACEILKTHDLIFANRGKFGAVETMLRGRTDIAFSPYGEHWRQVRSICVAQLLSNKMVESFRHIREEETSEMIEKIKHIHSSSPSSSLVNLSEMFVTLTNDVLFRTTLGRKYSGKMVGTIFAFTELLGVFNIADYIPWLAWVNRFNGLDTKVEKVAKEFHEFMDDVMKEHRRLGRRIIPDDASKAKGLNFLDVLLEIQKGGFNGTPLEDDDIKAIIIDMFAGGTDTTHTLMDWAMVELIRHPKTMQKLQNEVRQVAKGKSEVTEDDLQRMPFLKAVIKETLRLHCPVPLLVPHESTQDIKVMGYDISPGTQAIINGWTIGRDPQSWVNPETFQPERFLNSEIDFQGFHFELIPFGAGRRGCPGTNFAIVVNELVLAKLLHKFDFILPDGAKPEHMDMEEKPGINVKRKAPLLLVATPYSY